MNANRRRRPVRVVLLIAGAALLLLTALVVFGGSFGRGIALGVFGTFGAIVAFAKAMQRRMAKRAPRQFDPPPLPTETWDYSIEAQDLSGRPVDADAFRNTVVVLNIWATWCVPCTVEMPSLLRLQDRTAEFGVRFAFLSDEKSDVIGKFLERKSWTGPFYQLAGETPACFRTRGIPATFVVDRSGRIVLRHMGAARWDDDGIVAFLRALAVTPHASQG